MIAFLLLSAGLCLAVFSLAWLIYHGNSRKPPAPQATPAPTGRLSREEFDAALVVALREYWPEVDASTAVYWLRDYLDVPHGAKGYAWTADAARNLARLYVEDFGEAA